MSAHSKGKGTFAYPSEFHLFPKIIFINIMSDIKYSENYSQYAICIHVILSTGENK